jgi:hypothetical protein
MRRLLPIAGTLLVMAGCGWKAASRSPPPENPKYVFPHSTHLEAGLDCTTCHGPITQAMAIGPTVHLRLPQGDAAKDCLGCHDKVPAPPPPRHVEQTITFSHADHLSYVNGDCASCHKALPEPGVVQAPVPAMSSCTRCHNHAEEYAQARCIPCHVDLKRYPLKPVADFHHEGDFLRLHAARARTNATTCAACHEATMCSECHAATTRPLKPDVEWPERVSASFIHRGDYISRHTIDLRSDPASCRRCHGSAFCDACHLEQGVSQRAALSGGTNPHPPSWVAGQVHGAAARQDIISCAGCHDQGANSTCVTCHRNVNPHPASWGSRHNKTSDVSGNSMCRICHTS